MAFLNRFCVHVGVVSFVKKIHPCGGRWVSHDRASHFDSVSSTEHTKWNMPGGISDEVGLMVVGLLVFDLSSSGCFRQALRISRRTSILGWYWDHFGISGG